MYLKNSASVVHTFFPAYISHQDKLIESIKHCCHDVGPLRSLDPTKNRKHNNPAIGKQNS